MQVVMTSLQLLIQDLNIANQWAWLGQQVVIHQPSTIRVLCIELCAIDSLLQLFTAGGIPWSVHYNASAIPPTLSCDIVVILSHNRESPQTAIKVVAESVQHAYRARYLITHFSHVEDSDINALGSYAWSLRLFRVVFIRLQDRAIFAAVPRCHLPKIKHIPRVEWPDLRKMDLTNCILKVAVVNLTPYSTFHIDDESTLKGKLVPFFRFLQLGLKFKPSLIPVEFNSSFNILVSGGVDMGFLPELVVPDLPVKPSCLFISDLTWCVPNICVLRDTSDLLSKEFSVLTWILILTSVMAVSIAVKVTAAPPDLTLIDAVIRMIAIAAGISMNLPRGHARCPLIGWLIAAMVLGCCYQTVLHSMMAAPLSVPEVEDVYGLSRSKMDVACVTSAVCQSLLELKDNSDAESDVASRAHHIKTFKDTFAFAAAHKAAYFTSTDICESYFTESNKPLYNYRVNQIMHGLFWVTPWSWLSPAVREISLQLESSGLHGLYSKRDKSYSCVSVDTDDVKPIPIHLLRPAFVLWSVGLSLALVMFLAEAVWFRSNASSE